ncbi:Rrf2 family transcriptional regulator [Mechercharimyces sp. CAU 1602]|uniref:Rrf2 family transcriptional regulator n=1 Tax=Mechercharimyces sp. CAU 1602 TaxID=2973933 RepID=UPI002163B616|nr:Rrf2 family transcriptional regulator [Mechercharimyces sp. CAU 1602]
MRMKSGMEHAMYTLALLAKIPSRTSLSAEALSTRLSVSTSYFKKGMRQLVTADLVRSTPGVGGGFSLARPASQITMLEVYQAVEGKGSLYRAEGVKDRFFSCESMADGSDCTFARLMARAEAAWVQVLEEETLAKMVTEMETNCSPQQLRDLERWIQTQIK